MTDQNYARNAKAVYEIPTENTKYILDIFFRLYADKSGTSISNVNIQRMFDFGANRGKAAQMLIDRLGVKYVDAVEINEDYLQNDLRKLMPGKIIPVRTKDWLESSPEIYDAGISWRTMYRANDVVKRGDSYIVSPNPDPANDLEHILSTAYRTLKHEGLFVTSFRRRREDNGRILGDRFDGRGVTVKGKMKGKLWKTANEKDYEDVHIHRREDILTGDYHIWRRYFGPEEAFNMLIKHGFRIIMLPEYRDKPAQEGFYPSYQQSGNGLYINQYMVAVAVKMDKRKPLSSKYQLLEFENNTQERDFFERFRVQEEKSLKEATEWENARAEKLKKLGKKLNE